MPEYSVFYKSGSSCVFHKSYDDGARSIFNVTVSPITDGENKKTTFVFIDDSKANKEGWLKTKNLGVDEVLTLFSEWGPDAPSDYTRIISDHLGRSLRASDRETETKVGGEVGTKGAKVSVIHTRKKKL